MQYSFLNSWAGKLERPWAHESNGWWAHELISLCECSSTFYHELIIEDVMPEVLDKSNFDNQAAPSTNFILQTGTVTTVSSSYLIIVKSNSLVTLELHSYKQVHIIDTIYVFIIIQHDASSLSW